ncbi:MAG: hypothetical protein BWY63_00265 [Chloroflexi bacterium ADurb.Bin360]|nr:MAG: hypothetical protein BWY63_00265 [Chloroflexi bacterium ADurb.Bin360]
MNIRLVLMVGGLMLLSGCSLVTPTPEAPSATPFQPSPTPTALPRPTPLPASDLTTLTLWVPDVLSGEAPGEVHATLLSQINAFSRSHSNIQVQVLMKKAEGSGGLYDLLSTTYSAAPAVLPDLVILNHTDLRAAAENGFIVALPSEEATMTVYPFASEAVVIGGRAYGLPFLSQMAHTVYTPLPEVGAPLSWTTVLTGGYSLLFPLAPASGLADDFLMGAYLGSGGQVLDAEGRPLLDRPHLEELYRFVGVMAEAGLLDRERLVTLADAQTCWELFQQEGATVTRPLLSTVPAGLYWSATERVGLAAWTPTHEGRPFALAKVWSLAIVGNEPAHELAALELARWLNARGQVADFSKAIGMLPLSQEALALWTLSAEDSAFLERLLNSTVLPPPKSVDQTVRRALQAGLDFMLNTDAATPEQAATYALTVLRK